MKPFYIQLLDTKDNVFHSTVTVSTSISEALDIAKEEAYHQMDKNNIITRYVSVKDDNEHYVYNMLTKTTEKYY